jgi:NDP-sugar pyrophosphorylase family protein
MIIHPPHEAIILAGGLGTRLQAVVADRPKPMAEVSARPFIERILDQISSWGIQTAVLSVGHMAARVSDVLGERYGDLALRYAREATPLGTAGALRNALDLTEAHNLLVMNGDSYCDIDGRALMEAHLRTGAAATIVLINVPDASRAGVVELATDGSVTKFSARPPRAGAPGLINAGIYLFRRDVVANLPAGKRLSLEEAVFPALVGSGLRGWVAGETRFIDIGTPESYAGAAEFFARRRPQDA